MTQSFEELPAPYQQLTFEIIESYFLDIYRIKPSALTDLRNNEGDYTNYAYLISDQNPYHIKMRLCDSTFVVNGPVINQIDASMAAIAKSNPPITVRNRWGMYKRFPSMAIREALVNALIHSDFSAEEYISVSMCDDCLSISSMGGMNFPKDWKDVSKTNPRNWKLAELLIWMKYANLKGKGLETIRNCYAGSGLIPSIIKKDECFTVNLPALDSPVKEPDAGAQLVSEYLEKKHGALLYEISRDLMVSVYSAKKIVDAMESSGDVFTLGIGSNRRAYLVKRTERSDGSAKRRLEINK